MSAHNFLLISCEHGGNHIPPNYQKLFHSFHSLLDSHRGYDHGALELAKHFAEAFNAQLFFSETSRLLVELNRSLNSKKLFSEVTQTLPQQQKQQILDSFYSPYRKAVEKAVKKKIQEAGQVIHLSIHTFTPELKGKIREADVGFLYDPQRKREKEFCNQWKKMARNDYPLYRFRSNYPYQGKSDGFTTYLRALYGELKYIGVELEVNQLFPLGRKSDWEKMQECLISTLNSLLNAGVQF